MMADAFQSANLGGEGSNLAEVSRRLEGLQASVNSLEATVKSLTEKIERLADGRKTINVDHTLGQLEASVSSLDRRAAAHDETISQLLQWNSAVPNLEKNVDKVITDLNQLGQKRVAKLEGFVGTIKTLGWIAISVTGAAGALLVYFLHFLEAHVVFKP
jgi:hypothetical protein